MRPPELDPGQRGDVIPRGQFVRHCDDGLPNAAGRATEVDRNTEVTPPSSGQFGDLAGKREDSRPDHNPGAHRNGPGEAYRFLAAASIIFMRIMAVVLCLAHSLAVRKRSELSTTEIEEALMANAANIGLIRMPKKG